MSLLEVRGGWRRRLSLVALALVLSAVASVAVQGAIARREPAPLEASPAPRPRFPALSEDWSQLPPRVDVDRMFRKRR